jgi:hypothetical protein
LVAGNDKPTNGRRFIDGEAYCGEAARFWMSQDLPILRRCDEMLVLGLTGWHESLGVRQEVFYAISRKIPITLITEDDIDLLPSIPKRAQHFLTSQIFVNIIECDERKN